MDAVQEAGKQAKIANPNVDIKIGLAALKEGKDFMACTPLPPKAAAPVAPTQAAPVAAPGG